MNRRAPLLKAAGLDFLWRQRLATAPDRTAERKAFGDLGAGGSTIACLKAQARNVSSPVYCHPNARADMDDKQFDRPVRVRLAPEAKVLVIRSAHQASALLASIDWPGERTAVHRDAFETAEKVLEGGRSTIDARTRFEEAGREAGILVEGGDDDTGKAKRIYFESSVKVRPYGSSTVREVKSLQGASEVLVDWPHAKRGPFYQSARELVEAAIAGKALPSQAREAFVALAEHAGILVSRA